MNSNNYKVISLNNDDSFYDKSKKIELEEDGKEVNVYWYSDGDKCVDDIKEELKALEEQEKKLNDKLKPYLDELAKLKEESKKNIDKLHVYNEIKESCQMMFGKIAILDGKTIKQVYKEFDMELED
ncbi:hypothetical protein PPL_05736 [Heterostelium album PN500]|uniref:Uncharacterized protein n=1 Tax=Heterostelium pallidum (strain ATCC 26659 / Pp 5 / PN500) TaxID=670386 RepID=D3BB05_HETP5|nr:hypothetical protein PPL_05736 [Heterostelium album PN500]EFA81742.1 hypothetical protein PPL_05736 [Heterostelium album PN500]|eukprot:XP_020433859.1 hypothetical protein PPL_05736 [Heterostelium album PN500]